jgi:subtilisin family serine protease
MMHRRAAASLAVVAILLAALPFLEPAPRRTSTTAVWVFVRADAPRRPQIDAIRATGARLRYVSRWLAAVSVDADAAAVRGLRALPFVTGLRPVARMRALGGERAGVRTAVHTGATQTRDSAYYGPNWPALRDLRIPAAHTAGFTGTGVTVGIVDTGFEPRHESVAGSRLAGARDFIGADGIVYDEAGDPGIDQEVHGTRVWSLLAGNRPGRLVGTAPDATYLLAKVDLEPRDRQADEDRWVAAVEWMDSVGVDVIVSSIVFRSDFLDKPNYPFGVLDGDITITTRMADEAARRGILLVAAIGNDGPAVGTLAAPADADSVLAVGAVDALGQPALFVGGGSARGPTADGRTKPELVARGVGIVAASSATLSAYDAGLAGTSYSTPLIAGGAAIFMQAWPALSAMEVRDALLLAGDRAASPDDALGWGRPDVAAAIMLPRGIAPATVGTIDLTGTLRTIAPTFTWSTPLVQPSLRPILYRVELATDPVFNTIVRTDSVRDLPTLTFTRPVRPAQNLWWRVVAEGSQGIRRVSAVAGPVRMPTWVQLVSPVANRVTFVNTPRPELSWTPLAAQPPAGPLSYDIEVLSAETGQPVQPAVRNHTQASVRVPEPLVPNVAYRWRVIARAAGGMADTVESTAPFVVTSDSMPPATLLYQNFPNPFPRDDLGRATTSIWFDLAESVPVELSVHDQRGRLVRRLIPASPGCAPVILGPGQFGRGAPTAYTSDCEDINTFWDGTDANGDTVPRGVYILRLRAGAAVEYRHMIFVPN